MTVLWFLCVVLDHRSGEQCTPFPPVTYEQCAQQQREWAAEALGWAIRSKVAWDAPMSLCMPLESPGEAQT
jgi:hypothetical protein